ncbi:MAG: DUF1517 domain-containing protein [Xenococcaceae cyanobacterium MO_188.B29]|nr:DUF1517 domain-containing protein [Xenococcaceae cyanobacterium MO_188.B29]
MLNRQRQKNKFWLKSLLIIGLVLSFFFTNTHDVLAARTGGRIGGGSFRAPTRTYSAPRSGYRSNPGYGYPGGGGFGFPFLLPFFGFGGFGGLFSILIFIAIANFLVRSFSSIASGGDSQYIDRSQVSVAQVQVGLLSTARELQQELNNLALTADTSSASGRVMVLQESTLALLRHPEYWVYGATESQQTNMDAAEAKFNQLSLTERSKFTTETLFNVDNVIRQENQEALPNAEGELANINNQESGEYIIATIIIGTLNKLKLPVINGTDDLRQALQQMGSIGSDRLLAVEVLWTPQAEGDALTTNDILAQYPNLKLV